MNTSIFFASTLRPIRASIRLRQYIGITATYALLQMLLATPELLGQSSETAFDEGMKALLLRYDLPSAKAAFKRSVSEQPDSLRGYFQLGIISELQGNFREASDWYSRLLRVDSGAQVASVVRLHLATAMRMDDPAFSDSIKMRIRYSIGIYGVSILMNISDSLSVAFANIDSLRRLFPDEAGAYIIQANMLELINRYDEAFDLLKVGIEMCPKDSLGLSLLRKHVGTKRSFWTFLNEGKKHFWSMQYDLATKALQSAKAIYRDSIAGPLYSAREALKKVAASTHTGARSQDASDVLPLNPQLEAIMRECELYSTAAECRRLGCTDLRQQLEAYLDMTDENLRGIAWSMVQSTSK